jgi:hypothetical protein
MSCAQWSWFVKKIQKIMNKKGQFLHIHICILLNVGIIKPFEVTEKDCLCKKVNIWGKIIDLADFFLYHTYLQCLIPSFTKKRSFENTHIKEKCMNYKSNWPNIFLNAKHKLFAAWCKSK